MRNEFLEPETPEIDRDPEALNAFRQTWQAAVEAGRKGEAGKTAEARPEVEALSREAERLENECSLLEKQLAETRQELNHALEDATTARQEAREAREAIGLNSDKGTKCDVASSHNPFCTLRFVSLDRSKKTSFLAPQFWEPDPDVVPQLFCREIILAEQVEVPPNHPRTGDEPI